jgi:hypothetical protein
VVTRTPTLVALTDDELALQNRATTVFGAVTFMGPSTTEVGGAVDPTQLR